MSGLDFGRPSRIIMRYLCLFVCFYEKAVHVQLATDLFADSVSVSLINNEKALNSWCKL